MAEAHVASLYLDEDVHRRVAAALRLRQHDVVSAHDVRHWGLTDDEQLAFAASQGRAIVTFNVADFVVLHGEWLRAGRTGRSRPRGGQPVLSVCAGLAAAG